VTSFGKAGIKVFSGGGIVFDDQEFHGRISVFAGLLGG
jgi:hypothetical protein